MPQEAVKLLKELILAEHTGRLPMHPHERSYYTEKLNMSVEEAETRRRGSKMMFGKPEWDKPPEIELKHEGGVSPLKVWEPGGLLLYQTKNPEGRRTGMYHFPINWEFYKHIGQKIAENQGLKLKFEVTRDESKRIAYMNFHFSKE